MNLSDQTRGLYEDMILDHNRHPRHYPKVPPGGNRYARGYNPLCNDEILLHLRVEDDVVRDVGFEGAGCAVSIASASLLTEAVLGKTVEEARGLMERVRAMLADNGPIDGVGKLRVLAGVKDYPMRVKCATLAWHTLAAALDNRPDTVSTEDPAPVCPQPGAGP